MDPQELVPLEAGHLPRPPPQRQTSRRSSPRTCLQTPLRVFRLLAFLIVLPSLFLLVPLYMRYRVFSSQMYPMGMTDMRLIDSKISPTWCQRQVVKSNTTFNAFVVPGHPRLAQELVPVSMTRHMELEDDMKEYWGFYLLQGSTVTVSACVRWPGASLIMIKGYKHLQNCAYIGDDSSEELDELLEAYQLGLLSNTSLNEKILLLKKEDGKANHPDTMRRHKVGVQFHDPSHSENATSNDSVPSVDVTDHDPKDLREILERLHAIRQAAKDEALKHYQIPDHLMALPDLHRYRDTKVDREERKWLHFRDLDGNSTEHDNITKDESTEIIQQEGVLTTTKSNPTDTIPVHKGLTTVETVFTTTHGTTTTTSVEESDVVIENTPPNVAKADIPKVAGTPEPDASSREIFEDVLKKLQALGDRGKRVLTKLHQSMGIAENEKSNTIDHSQLMSKVTVSDEELDRLRQVLVEAIDEEKTRPQRSQKRRDARDEARYKRELMLGEAEFRDMLNEDDEARDYAAEEGLDPDGYAEHHTRLNETTPLDMSNSEFWSSFSSSEEALLECDGLILNLPLTPHSLCQEGHSEKDKMKAAKRNAVTYRVPANGYYFFVFNSENEVQRNYISVRFDLQKTRYDVARTTLRECRNSTARCDLPLDIFSSQKVVLELPLRDNESLWNEQYVVISECEPRTSIYLVCVIAVPVLIMVFGLQ